MQESRRGRNALGGLFYNPRLRKTECGDSTGRRDAWYVVPKAGRTAAWQDGRVSGVASGSSKISIREWAAIISIAATAFVFNTSEFMPIGLLVDISADFGVNEATGGVLITAYAWAVCILSVPLMVATSRFGFRSLLLAVVAVFGVGQLCSALAPGYWSLMGARLIVACAHAIFWSIAPSIAARVVSVEHRSVALSAIVTGSAVAQILGLPLGRVIGLALGWRMSFASIAAVTAVVLVVLLIAVPKMSAGEPFKVGQLPDLVKNPVLLSLFVCTAIMATAYYTGYSYVEPFLQQVGGLPDDAITSSLMTFGVAGIIGSFLFARFYVGQRRRFWYVRVALAGVALALALMFAAALAGEAAVLAVFVLWGICGTTFNVAFQSEILRFAPPQGAAVATAIFSGIFNLGIGSGSAVGGAVSTSLGMGAVCFAGALIGVVGVAIACVFLIPAMRRTKPAEQQA